MATNTIKTRIQLKNDTEAHWDLATNFRPKEGEVIIYSTDDTHPFSRLKIGEKDSTNLQLTKLVGDLPFIDAGTVNGHTINSNVPANAIFTDTTYEFDSSYNASTNKAATVATVTNAINALDVNAITGSTTKTITSISETNGKISATYSDIAFPVTSVAGKTGAVTLVKGDVGLGNVENTADANKTVLALTDFKVSKYTIPSSKGVRITYPSYSPVLISCQCSLGSGRLILIGGGYGEGGTVRNNFRELVSPSTNCFTWSLPNSASISCSIEIMNHNNPQEATVWVWASNTCTFTEITTLTTEAMNASLLTTASSIPWSKISSKPTTISGYGITDAKIANGIITLGSNTISSQAAANGGTTVSLVTTGEKYIWNSKTSNTGTVTSITLKAGTGISLDTDNTAITTSGTRTISNTGVTSIAGKTGAVTLADLGLSNAMHFLGVTTTNVSSDMPNTTATVSISGSNVTAAAGDVVLYGSQEYVWGNSKWNLLGDESSYKVKQTAKSDPQASTTTSTTFIDTISQDANGVITATKKTLPSYVPTSAGVTAVTWDATNKKLTRTINGTAADVVTIATIKTALTLTKSDVGLDNVTNSTYAGGTAVTLNNSSKASSTASFYAPTTGGTADTQALVGNGATTAPKWVNISPSITIGAGTGSAAPTINITILGQSGTAKSITTASTSVYGVTKLNDGIGSSSTTLAATANSAFIAAKKVASSNSFSKLYLVGATSQSATGVDSYSYQYTYTNNGLLSALKVGLNLNGTEKAHLEWNNTDQSIDFIFD